MLVCVFPLHAHMFVSLAHSANARIRQTEIMPTDKRTLTSPSQLFWCIANKKGGKGKLYYACREVDHPDQFKGLDLPRLKDGETCVQYFDYSAGACTMHNFENVRRTKLVPFHGSADREALDEATVPWCPELCGLYEKQLQRELRSKMADAEGRAVQVRVHMLFLMKALDHARAQEVETRRLTASQKKNAKRSRPTGCMSSNDIDAALAGNEADGNDASSEEDDDDEDDDDSLDPANKKRKTETLRPGDEIEYYSIMAVQGRKGDLHEAKIIAVDPKENPVLILDSGDVLPKDHFIRRVKKIHRGKLVDCDNANYQQIDYFRLSKASIEGFDSSKAHTAAFVKEASRVGGIIRRNMTKFQEKAQADGFAPMDMMNRYKGTNFDKSKAASEDIAAASCKQQELQQTINSAAGAAAEGAEGEDRKPSAAESQEEEYGDGDDAEKKTEDVC